jgi:hypothetical protein
MLSSKSRIDGDVKKKKSKRFMKCSRSVSMLK